MGSYKSALQACDPHLSQAIPKAFANCAVRLSSLSMDLLLSPDAATIRTWKDRGGQEAGSTHKEEIVQRAPSSRMVSQGRAGGR